MTKGTSNTKKPIEKKYTIIGFKRMINKKFKLLRGYERQFVMCKRCGKKAYYDYVPYSLSNPIMTTPCHHFFKQDYKTI
jgi:hypothetical protein